ncbi:tetratricopeptide repeat protein [Thermoflavimicrobium daqui]|uniref:Uncharacterized protein n=1 Tax=Thermoflavimicrobium daqui TaxID=2137476 RepID=A0A364K0H6_9BACL|nr:hypothetical protein DL897_17665 [Thermoflavimicrobium daqui]
MKRTKLPQCPVGFFLVINCEFFANDGLFQRLFQCWIEIARLNKEHNCSFDLWTSLGKIYFELENFEISENYFHTALTFQEKVTLETLLIDTYNNLGILYAHQNEWQLSEEYLNKALKIGGRKDSKLKISRIL